VADQDKVLNTRKGVEEGLAGIVMRSGKIWCADAFYKLCNNGGRQKIESIMTTGKP